jgi:hypothetical protein
VHLVRSELGTIFTHVHVDLSTQDEFDDPLGVPLGGTVTGGVIEGGHAFLLFLGA